jgi:hypothetical protein
MIPICLTLPTCNYNPGGEGVGWGEKSAVCEKIHRCLLQYVLRARIFKLLRSPGIDSKESIPPAYVASMADW